VPTPSPLFLAALDAHHELERLIEKLRNVRRRELTGAELYAIGLVEDRAEELADALERIAVREVVRRG